MYKNIAFNAIKLSLVFFLGFILVFYLATLPKSGSYFTHREKSEQHIVRP